jgi:hypothetical protein
MKTPFSDVNPRRVLFKIIILLLILAPLAQHVLADDTGSLIISSSPLGADIFLDGKYIGKAARNIVLENVVIGIHDVEWGMEHYKNCSKIIDVEPSGIATAYCELIPKEGNIVVTSDPPSALVILDGITVGKTNTTILDVLEGSHTVTLRYSGYYDCILPVTIEDMVTVSLKCVLEEIPTTGTISANSIPPGADVFLDEVRVGTSNVTIPKIEPGRHTLSFEKYGFDNWSTTLDIVAAQTNDINAILVLTNATLILTSSPSGANILYQGILIGKTPYQSKFFQGTNPFLLQGPSGYRNLTIRVIVPYEGANISVTLECAAQDAIDQAEEDINDNAMFNPSTARGLLQNARNLFASGKCVDAFLMAENASVWAKEDIFPYIPNVLIFFSSVVVGLSTLISIVYFRQICQLGPEVTIEELPYTNGQERMIRITAQLKKAPEFFYCAILLNGEVIDQLAEPGIKDVTLGRLDPGTYLIQVDLDAYRRRLWLNHVEESREIVIP